MDINNGTAPTKESVSQSDQSSEQKKKNIFMAVLSYIGPLVIVSYIAAKEDPFVKFHIKQGLVLFVIEMGVWVLGMMMWQLMPLFGIINFATFVLSIIGIMHAVKGEEKELPIVGKFSESFPV